MKQMNIHIASSNFYLSNELYRYSNLSPVSEVLKRATKLILFPRYPTSATTKYKQHLTINSYNSKLKQKHWGRRRR